jgi:hypothetical protein
MGTIPIKCFGCWTDSARQPAILIDKNTAGREEVITKTYIVEKYFYIYRANNLLIYVV